MIGLTGHTESRVDEKCSCGAEFHFRGVLAWSAANDWRTMHRHRTPTEPDIERERA